MDRQGTVISRIITIMQNQNQRIHRKLTKRPSLGGSSSASHMKKDIPKLTKDHKLLNSDKMAGAKKTRDLQELEYAYERSRGVIPFG